ncbi:MAG TPA: hypothetical protein VL122_09045 [Nitrospirota bacterium]|nr:hypothetical protein [Nitrospirota bacterium]
MKIKPSYMLIALLILCTVLLLSCGGNLSSGTSGSGGTGGGSGGGGGTTTGPTVAILTLSTAGATSSIYGLDFILNLPTGVTVLDSYSPPATDSNVIVASGPNASGTILSGVYTQATGTATQATVHVLVANANGLGLGQFCTVNTKIAAGNNPTAADFSITAFSAVDASGNPVTGITPGFTADIH